VDDGSSDNTDEVVGAYVEKDSRFKYFHRPDEHLPGGNGARNYGFKMSQGDYIQWFDSDDLMDIDFLDFKIDHIKENDLLITSGIKKDIYNNSYDLRMGFDKEHSLFKEIAMYNSEILTPTLIFNRAILKEIELFDESIKRGQETEFFTRIFFENNFKYIFFENKIFTYRISIDSKSSQFQHVFFDSRMKYFLDNLDRGLTVKDSDLTKRFYKKVISTLFDFIKIGNKKSFNFSHRELLKITNKGDLKIKFLRSLRIIGLLGFHSEKLRKFYLKQLD
jgi:glycosyltransferase involved in cell wall biosynthesis